MWRHRCMPVCAQTPSGRIHIGLMQRGPWKGNRRLGLELEGDFNNLKFITKEFIF